MESLPHPQSHHRLQPLRPQIMRSSLTAFLSPGGALCHSPSAGPLFWPFSVHPELPLPIPEPVVGGDPSARRFTLLCPEPNVRKHTHVAQEGRNKSVRDRPQAKSADDRNMKKKAKSKKNTLYVSSAAFKPSAALPMGWASPSPARRATGPAVHAVPFCECAVQLSGYFPVPSLETPTAGL